MVCSQVFLDKAYGGQMSVLYDGFKCDWLVGSQRAGPLGIWGQNGTAEKDLVFTTIKHESRLSWCVYSK